MQPIQHLLSEIARQGIALWVENGELRFRGPPDAIKQQTFAALRERKKEAIAFLDVWNVVKALPQVTKAERSARIPLSLTQRTIWEVGVKGGLHDQITMQIPLSGPAQLDLRTRALNRIIERHEILRTVYREAPGGVEQVVLDSCPLTVGMTDLSGLPAAEAREKFDGDLAPAFRKQRIDLATGPCLLAHMFILGSEAGFLLLSFHRLAVDLASRGILVAEFAEICRAGRAGTEPKLESLALQFADVAIWEASNLRSDSDDVPAYWRMRLAGIPVTNLAREDAQAVPPFKAAMKPIHIPQPTAVCVLSAAMKAGAAPELLLAAAAQALISIWAGRPRTAIGYLVDARPSGTEGLIGPFARLQPLTLDVTGSASFADVLKQTREGALAAANLARLILPEDLDAHALQNTILNVRRTPASATAIETAQPPAIWQHVSIFLRITPATISGRLDYAADMVDEARTSWFATGFAQFLDRACETPEAGIDDLARDLGSPR
jgi:hypothetical protein